MDISNILVTIISSIGSVVVLVLLATLVFLRKGSKSARNRKKTVVLQEKKHVMGTPHNDDITPEEKIHFTENEPINEELMAPEPETVTPVNLRWPLFEEKELSTMGWDFLFCKEQWDEVNVLLRKGQYEEAERKTREFKGKYMDSLIMFDLLLLEAQHRKGDFNACSETYKNTNRPSLAFFSAKDKTPLVLEYCEAMLDLQGTIPMWIQAAWKGAHDCLNNVMRSNPPERSYVICIRAFMAAVDIGQPLFGGDEEALIKDYIKSGLSWYPESKTLLKLKSYYE